MEINEQLKNAFSAVSDNAWNELIQKDLKGKDFGETLVWKDGSGIAHQPVYRRSSLPDAMLLKSIQDAQRSTSGWKVLESLEELPDPIGLAILEEKSCQLEDLSKFSKIAVETETYRSKGATAVQELAYALQHVLCYLDQLTEEGLEAKTAIEKLDLRLSIGTSYFSEIAKGRAFRFLLKRLLKPYGVETVPAITALGSKYELTHLDAHSNLLRTCTQGMAAVMGGCEALYLPSYDDFGKPSELGKRMARNMQLIYSEESYFSRVIDPSSGSYYIEKLTAELAQKAWAAFLDLESRGGLLLLLEKGILKEELNKSHQKRLGLYQSNQRKLLGVNAYQNPKGVDFETESQILAKEIQS